MRMTQLMGAAALFALGLGVLSAGAQTAPAYAITPSAALGAPDRWDYLTFDAASHRVYIAHGDRISVIDARSGAVLGAVLGMPGGTHGIGLSGGKGYTDDGKAGEVVVFDPASFKVLKRIPALPDADGITVDPTTGHVFVVDGDSAALTVIDPAVDTAIATIKAGGGLEFAVAGPNGKVYVNGAENKELLRIDTATNTIDARWPVPGCVSPHGLALDAAGHRLFTTCVNQVMVVVNTDTGAVVATLPIGRGTDAAGFDPVRKLAFSANGEGTITVVQETTPDSFSVLGAVKTQATGRTMTLDPATGRLYIAAAEVDTTAPVVPGPNGRPGRAPMVPGSLKVLMLDPAR